MEKTKLEQCDDAINAFVKSIRDILDLEDDRGQVETFFKDFNKATNVAMNFAPKNTHPCIIFAFETKEGSKVCAEFPMSSAYVAINRS